ncbi:MAG: hypothetical protein RMJ55_10780, partial [Roseiflexaceae bacterium]|nr:hypothetical protein [Roseiflexaceae bacterium]
DVADAVRAATWVDDAASAARMASLGWGNGSSEALRANLKAAGLQPLHPPSIYARFAADLDALQ